MQQVEACKFVSKMVKETLRGSMLKAFPELKVESILLQSGPKGECDYVSPSAMKEFNMNKDKKKGTAFDCKSATEFAQRIANSHIENEVISSVVANDKGFLQIKVSNFLVESRVNDMMKDLSYPIIEKQNIAVDFSSPNIAKEMHVGHLRSTIIGESICRMMEFQGLNVHRINHVGDWGTQFGMLIAYMKLTFPDYEEKTPEIKDLDSYYKAARAKFDSDPEFKKLSQETVVQLQAYDQSCIKAWKSICSVSRDYFSHIYERLQVKLEEFGESFYNKMIPPILEELNQKNLIKEDATVTKKRPKKDKKKEKKKEQKGEEPKKEEKVELKKEEKEQEPEEEEEDFGEVKEGKMAKCIFIEKYNFPLIVVKGDGGYGYDSTDIATIKFRLQNLKANRIIYVTDLGQREHFEMIIAAARKAEWLTNQRVDHMGFGVVLGEDKKKFSTRKGQAVKLLDLLNEAKERAMEQLKKREKNQDPDEGQKEKEKEAVYTALKPEEYEVAAERLGIAAIKYYDLKQNRASDYVFDFEKMLDPKGNTAVYLIYAYVRMCSIIRKSGLSSQEIHKLSESKKWVITHPDERNLAAMLIKFYDVLSDSVDELALNKMTDFIYEISVKVQENYKKYRIIGDPNMETRIILVELIRRLLEKAFFMVGIVPVQKI